MSERRDDSASPGVRRALLIAIVVAGATVRLWGIGFGLPLARAHPDEPAVTRVAVEIARGDLNPHFFNYPTLYMYVVAGVYRAYCEGSSVTARFESAGACLASWPARWEPFFLLARAVTAAAGVFTIFLTYRLALRFVDTRGALAAAAFLAGAFLHARDSHFAVTDVAMTMLVVAAVLATVRAHDESSLRGFAWAGLLAGLAAATKYNALLLLAVAAGSQWIAAREGRRTDGRLPLFAIALGCGFALGVPYALIDHARFWSDATSEALHLAGGHGTSLQIGWIHHLAVSLRYGLTLPLLIAALAGMVWMSLRGGRRVVLLIAFPLVYYAVAGRGYTVFARYMVPVVPFLCIGAGWLVSRLAALATRSTDGRYGHAAAALLAAALVTPSVLQVVTFDRLLTRTDSRVLASEWFAGEVPPGATVYLAGGMYGVPDLAVRGAPPPYRLWDFDERRGRFDTPSGLTDDWPEWIVTQESPLSDYSRVPQGVRDGLRRYDLRIGFRAVNMNVRRVYDEQDAFFLPLSGFRGIGRPGPNISVYRRRLE